MNITIKKIVRIGIYSALLGTVGLFASLFSRHKHEYHINLNPPNLNPLVNTAHAEASDSGPGDSGSSGGSSASDM